MSLNDTMNKLDCLIFSVSKDLAKATRGNKTAAQRVRVSTIKLEAIAKQFRKESVAAEKTGKFKRKLLNRKYFAKKGKKKKSQ